MSGFYKNVAVVFLVLAVVTSGAAYVSIKLSYLSDVLLPVHKSAIPWAIKTSADADQGGSSSITVNDSTYSLDFDFEVLKAIDYPYVSFDLEFKNSDQFIDLSNYTTLAFSVLCKPHNVFNFAMRTFDDQFTRLNDPLTFRTPGEFFSCNDHWTRVEIDIRHLTIPEWWLQFHHLELSNREYRLDRVLAFSFGITGQSPVNTPSNIRISELALHGRDQRYIYALYVFAALVWGLFALWLFKYHTNYLIADVKEKMRHNWPLLDYQKLSVEPQKDREKTLLLRFIATEYANPDLSLEKTIDTLGINRTKINEILKKELGFTFTTYLNKLRLTESARLLLENDNANVAEIAYLVGYNNVTYFNKLFKTEYSCAPKKFKNMYESGVDAEHSRSIASTLVKWIKRRISA
jgi:AraC-like DNA-binding protein